MTTGRTRPRPSPPLPGGSPRRCARPPRRVHIHFTAGRDAPSSELDTKETRMRAAFAAILILLIGGAIAFGAYDAGVAQGAAQVVIPAGGTAPAVAPAVAYYGHPYGYGWGSGFLPFGFLFPILGLFLFFALLRGIFGGWGRGHGHGWYSDGVPSRFDEWHKRVHGDTAGPDRSASPRP